MKKNLIYRFSQLLSLLLGVRFLSLIFYAFTLYVSAYFLFSQEDSFRHFIFDYKANGIILCSLLSISSGGIINQFYDLEKDRLQRPFRSKLQSFLQQKYFLYYYLLLSLLSLGIALGLSVRIFLFFIVYQFFIWFYSHKISKVFILNNLVFVALTLYPFFGMLVYYQHFSVKLAYMSIFLFLMLLNVDIIKDIITMRADKVFGYATLPIVFGLRITHRIIVALLGITAAVSSLIINELSNGNLLQYYFVASIFVMFLGIAFLVVFKFQKLHWLISLFRFWVFLGVVFMLFSGISGGFLSFFF